MNRGSSQSHDKFRIGLKTAIAGTMILIMFFGFATHLDFAAAQTTGNSGTGPSNCKATEQSAYQSSVSSAKTIRNSAIQQAKQTDQTAEQQYRSTYQQAVQTTESAYKTGQQANLTAAKNTIATAQTTLKTALQTDKGNPTKIAADRSLYANTVGQAYSQYYINLYQAASERAHVIWSAAATRDANIEGVRETMWNSIGQAWGTYYTSLYGFQATYYNALAACQAPTSSSSTTSSSGQ
jgi:delta 1-pyrroline-5-carboxylate dehydrogenase